MKRKKFIKETKSYYYKTPKEVNKKVKAVKKLGYFVTINPPTLFRKTYKVTVTYKLKLQ